jgi:hypothetical protein
MMRPRSAKKDKDSLLRFIYGKAEVNVKLVPQRHWRDIGS